MPYGRLHSFDTYRAYLSRIVQDMALRKIQQGHLLQTFTCNILSSHINTYFTNRLYDYIVSH